MADLRKPGPTLCIGILTLNEADRIARCLRSAAFADQVVVVDSGSDDRTCEIARELGAQVHVFADWQGFAEQRNRLLSKVDADYVFFLDADEVIPEALAGEIRAAVASAEDVVWKIYWDQVAFGRTLDRMAKAEGGVWRLFRTDQLLRYEGVVHEHAVLRNPATLAVARQPGNAGYINFLTNWVQQQRSLGKAQGKLNRAWEERGIDMSILPAGFSF